MKKRTVSLAACALILTLLGLLCLAGGPETRPAWAFTVNLPSESPETTAPTSEPTATESTSNSTPGSTATTPQPPTGSTPTDPSAQSKTPAAPGPAASTPGAASTPAPEAPAGRPWGKYIGIGFLVLVGLVIGIRYMNRDDDDD